MKSIYVAEGQTTLQASEISFKFPQKQIFSNFSASIQTGITYVTGDESSGKTTLLRLLAGDLTSQTGDLIINGINVSKDLSNYQKNVFWIDPRTSEFDQISANDFFDLQRMLYVGFDEVILVDLIETLSLKDHVTKAMYMLSAGSKRKVWIAAAFASGAAVTLLDEPFAALDQASIYHLIDRLERSALKKERTWVIADYVVPQNLSVHQIINLDELQNI